MTDWTLIDNLITSQFEHAQEGVNPITSAELADFAKKVVAVAKVGEVVDTTQTTEIEHLEGKLSIVEKNARLNYRAFRKAVPTYGRGQVNDPYFQTGFNGLSPYDNNGLGNVQLTRVPYAEGERPDDVPSNVCVEVRCTGETYAGFGGAKWQFVPKPNRVYQYWILAKIPVGRVFHATSNGIGATAHIDYLSPRVGTGNWEVYEVETHAGADNISNTGFFTLTGGAAPTLENPLTWHIAECGWIEMEAGYVCAEGDDDHTD